MFVVVDVTLDVVSALTPPIVKSEAFTTKPILGVIVNITLPLPAWLGNIPPTTESPFCSVVTLELIV